MKMTIELNPTTRIVANNEEGELVIRQDPGHPSSPDYVFIKYSELAEFIEALQLIHTDEGLSDTDEEAKQECLEHWRRLRLCKTPREVYMEGHGADECAFCELYLDLECAGCPIAKKTGKVLCDGSPYDRVDPALDSYTERGGPFPAALIDEQIRFLEEL